MQLINKTDNPGTLSSSNKIKFLFRDTLFFGGLRAVSLLFPFLTIPLLTGYFSVENYGLYDSLMVLAGFVSLFFVFGQDSAVARWFYQVDEKEMKKQVISESFFLQLLFAIIIVTTLLFNTSGLSKFYFNDRQYSNFIVIILIQSIFLLLNNFTVNILKWSFDRKKYAVLSLLSPFLLLLSLLAVYFFRLTLTQYFYLNLLAVFISSLCSLYYCRHWLIFPRKFLFFKKLLLYGVPLGIIASTSALMPAIDRKMIVSSLGFESLGVYAIAFKIAAMVMIADGIFQMAWGPFSLSIFKENDAEKVYNSVIKIYLIFFLVIILCLLLAIPILIKILANQNYADAGVLILPLIFAMFFNGMSGITGVGIGLSMKSYLNIIPFVVSVLVLIACLVFLIPLYHLKGVACSLLIANAVKLLVISFLARKVYREIQINFMIVFLFSLLFLFVFYIAFYMHFPLFVNILIIIASFIILYYSLFSKTEKQFIVNLSKRIFNV